MVPIYPDNEEFNPEKHEAVSMDEDNKNVMSCINFNRIKGGKPFNIYTDWFVKILTEIGQK